MAAATTTPPVATFSTGRIPVPTSLTVITPLTKDLMGAHFANPTANSIYVTVTNGAGSPVVPTVEVPANFDIGRDYPLMPEIGLSWQASASGLIGHIWGYERE